MHTSGLFINTICLLTDDRWKEIFADEARAPAVIAGPEKFGALGKIVAGALASQFHNQFVRIQDSIYFKSKISHQRKTEERNK